MGRVRTWVRETRWTGALLVAAALLAVPLAGVSAQSPGAVATGDVIGRFTAHLRGSQMDHSSTLLNVKYSPPGKGCKPGMRSYSTDQEMVFESEPVQVEAVRLPPDAEGWGGQAYVLVAQGMDAELLSELVTWSAPAGDMDSAPVLFELPLDVKVTRANAQPANGEGPAEPQPFTVACTGGDGPGGSIPPLDCGERTITSSMAITQPQTNVAVPASGQSTDGEAGQEPYTNCPGSVDEVPGGFAWGYASPATYTGGSAAHGRTAARPRSHRGRQHRPGDRPLRGDGLPQHPGARLDADALQGRDHGAELLNDAPIGTAVKGLFRAVCIRATPAMSRFQAKPAGSRSAKTRPMLTPSPTGHATPVPWSGQ